MMIVPMGARGRGTDRSGNLPQFSGGRGWNVSPGCAADGALHTLIDKLPSGCLSPLSLSSARTDALSGWFSVLFQVPTTVLGP